jgi:two-component sensor histidine kinase
MSSIRACSAERLLDPAVLRSVVAECRLELAALREDAATLPTADNPAETRLCQVAERLEQAASTLHQVLGLAVTPASAEVMAREADYRVRNSLQAVASLLQQQAGQVTADAATEALKLASLRVRAVAQVHDALTAVIGQVPPVALQLDAYLADLCAAQAQAMELDGVHRILHVEVEPVAVSPAMAQMLGLVTTELVTNALRHAFPPGEACEVRVAGARGGDGCYQLSVSDDGQGLPADFDLRLRPSGLGLRLVSMIADQLRARLAVDGEAGARFVLTLPPSLQG